MIRCCAALPPRSANAQNRAMKVVGVGLGKTGTASLAQALRILGCRTLHWAPDYMSEVFEHGAEPDFSRYAGWDAVTDIPAALFFREFMIAFPECRFVLTIRDEREWLASAQRFYGNPERFERFVNLTAAQKEWARTLSDEVRKFAYGSEKILPSLYLRRFREHNELVQRVIPPARLLVMDITKGDGWSRLCPFLGCPIPAVPFPRKNTAETR
jgi:hypothetical protein